MPLRLLYNVVGKRQLHWLQMVLLLLSASCFSSVPVLERELNLVVQNEKIGSVLEKIQDQANLVFSYQPSLLEGLQPVTAQLIKKTVREALSLLLPRHIAYKAREHYVILKMRPKEEQPKKTEISGYVYDKETNEKVADVTVYDKKTLKAATTDAYGYYSLTVPAEDMELSVNKETYEDTVVNVPARSDSALVNIVIDRRKDPWSRLDSIRWKETASAVNAFSKKLLRNFRGFIHTINVKDTLTRNFQVSALPFFGMNGLLSGNVVNHLSLNLLGGYARGLDGIEIGGLFNTERQNVKGCQLAGLFNAVGDSVRGSQLAGLMNITGKAASGFQAAGLMNVNEGAVKGVQAAGLLNIAHSGSGTSMAGLMNISGRAEGAVLAGLANVQDTLEGLAAAGLFNRCAYGKNTVQIAGLFNVNDKGSSRAQLAGLFNRTSQLRGVQVAVLNFCDSATGVPIGLLSFSKKGIHQMEISGNEVFPVNVGFRTGVPAFYNIVVAGIRPGKSADYWQLGYGIGSSLALGSKLSSDLQISVQHVSRAGFYFAANEIYQSYLGLEYRAGKKFSVAAGPTFNLFISDTYIADFSTDYEHLVPSSFYNSTNAEGYNIKCWIGGRLALRFF